MYYEQICRKNLLHFIYILVTVNSTLFASNGSIKNEDVQIFHSIEERFGDNNVDNIIPTSTVLIRGFSELR